MSLLALILPAGLALAGGPEFAWRDWNTGLREAKASGRTVLVDVYTDWCGWCRRMDRDVYSRPEVRRYLAERYVTIKLDADADSPAGYEGKTFTARTLAARFRVTGYPTTIFLRSGGEHVANVPGYIDADRFIKLLRYVGDGHLDRGVSWEDYVQQTAAGSRAGH